LNILNSTPSPPAPAPAQRTKGRPRKNALSPYELELKKFKELGVRGPILKKVLTELLKISPTSVDSERAFSVAGVFVTKLRSRLAPVCIFALTFLNAHFKRLTKTF
jgi:hypothetical protein